MKKKIRKALGAVLLAVAIAITQIPATNVDAASDFQMDGNILMKYTGTTAVVSVPDGTKEIATEAFAGCTTMTTLHLPKSLEKIDASAFRGCNSLTSVQIPQGCEIVESQAFADCTSLVDVSIPASLHTLGSGVFAGDKKLAAVNVNVNNTSFVCRDGILYSADMTKLIEMFPARQSESYVMPTAVTDIEKYAFWGCKNLKEITLSNYLEEIPAYAFSYCRGLKNITLPYSVKEIQAKAFENCRELTDVTIPASVSYIHPTAFDGCVNLNIIAETGSVAEQFFATFDASDAAMADYEENEDQVSLAKNVKQTTSGVNTSDVSDATVVEVPDGDDVLGRTKIVFQQAVVFVDNAKMEVLEGDASVTDTQKETVSVSENTDTASENGEDDLLTQKYTIVGGNTVADKAYYGKSDLTQYTFPTGIENIGDFSFARSGLTSVAIPAGVNHIGYGAFYHCDSLNSISIPSTVTDIEPAAFERTPWLEAWKQSGDVDDFLVVGDGILIAYKGTKRSVQIPSNVKKIGPEVFKDHTEIAAVYLPDHLVEIGEDAFSGCTNLTQISGGSLLTKISDRAFYNCPLNTARVGANVKEVGLQAFAGNDLAQAVVFQGKELPVLSYEKTATRLSNDDYRAPAFSCQTAVVDGSIKKFEDTILDKDSLGFRGLVVSVQTEPTTTTYGSVRLEYCTLEADRATGVVSVPESVTIFGQEYKITSVSDTAFEPYGAYETWVQNNPTDISINSAITQGKDVTEGLALADSPGMYKRTVSENSAHITIQDENQIVQDGKVFRAEFEHLEDDFYLHLSKEEESAAKLEAAVQERYGALSKGQLFSFDMCLYDRSNQIPITRLGKEPLTITMSIPPGMEDDTLCMVCLDHNGQLETNFVNYVTENDNKCIQFEVTHFSPYGIYAADGSLADQIDAKISNPSHEAGKDISPDTGDYLDPKWFLAAGCISLALFLFLWKK